MRNETRYELTPDNYFTVQVKPNGVPRQYLVDFVFKNKYQHGIVMVDVVYLNIIRVWIENDADTVPFEKCFEIQVEGITIGYNLIYVAISKETEIWLAAPAKHLGLL